MKKIISVLLLSGMAYADSTSVSSGAVESPSIHSIPNQYSTYIGIAGGLTSGYGLSVRKWFDNSWALQLNLFPLYTQQTVDPVVGSNGIVSDSGYQKDGQVSLGILFLKKITDFKFGRIVYYNGMNFEGLYHNHDYYSLKWDGYYTDSMKNFVNSTSIQHEASRSFSKKLTVGTGAGSEFYIWRFALHLMLGVCAGYDFSTGNVNMTPSIEGGVQFRLK